MVEQSGNVLIADKGSARGTFKWDSGALIGCFHNLYLGSFRVQKHMLEDWLEKLIQLGELLMIRMTETDLVMETTQTLDSAAASAMQSN